MASVRSGDPAAGSASCPPSTSGSLLVSCARCFDMPLTNAPGPKGSIKRDAAHCWDEPFLAAPGSASTAMTETLAPRRRPWNSPDSSPRAESATSRTRVTPHSPPTAPPPAWVPRGTGGSSPAAIRPGPLPRCAGDEVGGPGEDHELGFGEVGQIPHRAAPQKAKQLDGVFETDDVGRPTLRFGGASRRDVCGLGSGREGRRGQCVSTRAPMRQSHRRRLRVPKRTAIWR